MTSNRDIRAAILGILDGSTGQKPVPTEKLYPLGSREQVEAALLEMYRAGEIGCCKITRHGVEKIVWWELGKPGKLPRYGTGPLSRVGKGWVAA